MNFFELQDRARKRTRWLIFFFALAVIATAATVSLSFAFILELSDQNFDFQGHWQLIALIAGGVIVTIVIGSLWKLYSISDGGVSIALIMGGRLVDRDSARSDQERTLLNVVEEMAIASGTPVPSVFVMDSEPGINAFAAGFDTKDAIVSVTKGALDSLSRDELQGVIGHEFSHIANGDMRLNMRLLGLLAGLVLLTSIGQILIRGGGNRSSSRSKGGGQVVLIGLTLFLLGWIGYFFGRLIQASVSRQREFLADASSVQFTRNPDGILNALTKIGQTAMGSLICNDHSDETRHFFFSNAFSESWLSLFSSHPPLGERIKALDPRRRVRFQNFESPALTAPSDVVVQRFTPPSSAMGHPMRQNRDEAIVWSAQLLKSLPNELLRSVRDPILVQPLIGALVISSNLDPEASLSKVENELPQGFAAAIRKILPAVLTVQEHKLSIFLLCLGTLSKYSANQVLELENILKLLVKADGKFSLFEYSLFKMIEWKRRRTAGLKPLAKFYSMKPLKPEAAILISAVAHLSKESPREAFDRGARKLDLMASDYRNPSDVTLTAINKALERLQFASPAIKARLLEACAATALADDKVIPEEWQLLRAISLVFEHPLPPILTPFESGVSTINPAMQRS